MAYTELTSDDDGLTLETLERMSLVDMGDGTWAQQVVIVAAGTTLAFDMTAGSLSGRYVDTGMTYNGRTWFVLQGQDPGDESSIFNSCVYEIGFGWVFSNDAADIIYACDEDVTDPTLCVTWTDPEGNPPTPTISALFYI